MAVDYTVGTRTGKGGGTLYRGTLRDAKDGTISVSIQSNWRDMAQKVPKSQSAQQTVSAHTDEATTQSVTQMTHGTMTLQIHSGIVNSEGNQNTLPTNSKVSDEELVNFLRKAVPLLEEELTSAEKSKAFEFRGHVIDERHTTIDITHVLRPKLYGNVQTTTSSSPSNSAGPASGNPHKLVCTQLSWNCNGYAIAASYGRCDISSWCDYPGALAVWNLGGSKPKKDKTKDGHTDVKSPDRDRKGGVQSDHTEHTFSTDLTPDIIIETDMCLQCCACHPAHPALVAAGSYSGEVYIWNVGLNDDLSMDTEIARSRISASSHHEPVVSVAWHYSISEAAKRNVTSIEAAYLLISLGMDGKVLIWQWTKGGIMEAPLMGYELVYSQPQVHKMIVWGGTCMSFQQQQQQQQQQRSAISKAESNQRSMVNSSTFIVGTEGGAVFRCLLDDQNHKSTNTSTSYRSPVKAQFAPHAGLVYAASCSPFDRSLFLTTGSDSTIKLYNILFRQPLLDLEPCNVPLFSASWSPSRPLLFAVGSGDGRVFFYDLAASKIHPAKVVDTRIPSLSVSHVSPEVHEESGQHDGLESERHQPVYSLQFNPKLPSYFASSYGESVRIWTLGPQLAESLPGEIEGARAFVHSAR